MVKLKRSWNFCELHRKIYGSRVFILISKEKKMINNFGIPHVNNKKFYTTLKVLHLINACLLWYCITRPWRSWVYAGLHYILKAKNKKEFSSSLLSSKCIKQFLCFLSSKCTAASITSWMKTTLSRWLLHAWRASLFMVGRAKRTAALVHHHAIMICRATL